MLEQLRADFESFREECIWCCIIYNTHQSLFESGEKRARILKDTAHRFFFDYSVMSQEYHVMLVGRLTDPPESAGNSNLTVKYLVQQLENANCSSGDVQAAADGVQAYRSRIKESRNKLVAHRDAATIRNGIEPKEWPVEETQSFHRDLNKFCDAVAIQLGLQPTEFCNVPVETFPLIKHLESSLKAKAQRKGAQ
ncbi:MAG: hypothetical protein CMH66_02470 [Nioella sp.]|nr:hypothetical protein [Nioella sp.]